MQRYSLHGRHSEDSTDDEERGILPSNYRSAPTDIIGTPGTNANRPVRPILFSEPSLNLEKSVNKCGLNSPIVEIREVPEEDDFDSEPILFEFDRFPVSQGKEGDGNRAHIKSMPSRTRDDLKNNSSPEGNGSNGPLLGAFSAHIPVTVNARVSPCSSPAHSYSRSPSPGWSLSNLSPLVARRKRGCPPSVNRNVEAILGVSPPVRIPRDPIQPTSGSIADVHSEASFDDEESDTFSMEPRTRQRSNTCPESRAFRRRVRMRNMNRPPTPPPGGADDLDIEILMSRMVIKEKLKIPSRELPGVPEFPNICNTKTCSSPNLSLQ